MDFSGKVILITGASSSIGAASAVYFATLGAKLSLNGRNEEKLKKTLKECNEASKDSESIYIVGDVSKVDDVENILKKTIEKYGRLDVLVNNAGFTIPGNLETVTLDQLDTVFNTNIRGLLYLTQKAMPYLIESKGNVVNNSSVLAFKPYVGSLPYVMSKAALDQFTKCVALEVAPKGVRVNSVNPGGVLTNFAVTGGFATEDNPYEAIERWSDSHAIGRCGTSWEIATAIAFLASDLATNVTGSIFVVDGGLSIK